MQTEMGAKQTEWGGWTRKQTIRRRQYKKYKQIR